MPENFQHIPGGQETFSRHDDGVGDPRVRNNGRTSHICPAEKSECHTEIAPFGPRPGIRKLRLSALGHDVRSKKIPYFEPCRWVPGEIATLTEINRN